MPILGHVHRETFIHNVDDVSQEENQLGYMVYKTNVCNKRIEVIHIIINPLSTIIAPVMWHYSLYPTLLANMGTMVQVNIIS